MVNQAARKYLEYTPDLLSHKHKFCRPLFASHFVEHLQIALRVRISGAQPKRFPKFCPRLIQPADFPERHPQAQMSRGEVPIQLDGAAVLRHRAL